MRPTSARSSSEGEHWRRGSLSDFSDYESSDEETHNRAGPSSGSQQYRYDYAGASDDDLPRGTQHNVKHVPAQVEDPFADPFAD